MSDAGGDAGVTGSVSMTQCASADYTTPGLLTDAKAQCGDRPGIKMEMSVYSDSGARRAAAWTLLGTIDTTAQKVNLLPGAAANVRFLGNSAVTPKAYEPPPTCQEGPCNDVSKRYIYTIYTIYMYLSWHVLCHLHH